MCGICGYYGEYDRELLSAMSASIVHRGPDDSGIFQDRSGLVGLAHRRLSIIDLSSNGRQPMSTCCDRCNGGRGGGADGDLTVVYNGEIYNYRELRSELESKGHRFQSATDTEVLLHLYAELGPQMLERLNGIFAFAIYDGRRKNQNETNCELFLARDGLGVKPLYYSETTKGFVFASELKALRKCPEVDAELDLVGIHHYLAYLWCPAPLTPLKSVKKMEPGQALIINGGKIVKRWHFYDIPYGQQQTEWNEEKIAEALTEKLHAAVQRQLIADVPIGAFLSGGLDSSSIVAMMRKIKKNDDLRCYCIGFEGSEDVEDNPLDLPYARRVAAHMGVDLSVLVIKPDIIKHLGRMLYHLDEPQADLAPINAYLISQQARSDGVKVLMSGVGGDDIFSGYRRHRALIMEPMWTWLPGFARKYIAATARGMMDGRIMGGLSKNPIARRFSKALSFVDSPEDRRLVSYFYWSTECLRRSLYSEDVKRELEKLDTAEPLLNSLKRIPKERNRLNSMLYLETKHFLADHNLNYTDKVSMAAGIEVRVPLLDRDLVEFATTIPPHMKQTRRTGKAIFKKAMESCLPREVIYRPKAGFCAPVRRWVHQELKPLIGELLSEKSIRNRGLFDPNAVERLLKLEWNSRIDASYTILSLVCIEMWCRMFVDKRGEVYEYD
ncbi:MAG: asparagine synthase (glutamine-hydrolyzing) [Pseudomonadota bacterium]